MTRATNKSAGSAAIALSASLALFSNAGDIVVGRAAAKDLGVHGTLFEIVEPDAIEQIYKRLRDMEANGEIARANRAFAERARAKIERPAPVAGIKATVEARTWLHDPTITIGEDVTDHEGRLIARAGTKINPLDHQAFTQTLVFIDGDDEAQIAWARETARDHVPTHIILVAGAPLHLIKTHETPFFFDQEGLLTTRFGITHVPATVRQDGLALRVSEVTF